MQLRQLEYILAISECQTISAAADKLFISRSSLNTYLLNLENSLQTPLFYRKHKKLIPTFAGETFIAAAKQIVGIYDQLNIKLQEIADCSSGQINLGVNRTTGEQVFRKLFSAFHQKYPDYLINLTVSESMEELLLNGTVDWALIGYGNEKPMPSQLAVLPLGTYEIVLALPKSHRLAVDKGSQSLPFPAIDLSLLKDEKFVMLNPNFNARMIADRYFSSAGFTPKIAIECNSGYIVSKLVKDGLGPSILIELLVAGDPHVSYFSLQPKAYWTYCICYRKNTVFSKAEQYFIHLIQEHIEQHNFDYLT